MRQGALVLPVESYAALSDSLRGWMIPGLAPMGSPLLNHSWRYTVREDLGRSDARASWTHGGAARNAPQT